MYLSACSTADHERELNVCSPGGSQNVSPTALVIISGLEIDQAVQCL